MKKFIGIEGGGTKFLCAVGDSSGNLDSMERIPTTTPEETMGKIIAWMKQEYEQQPFSAVGIASFGPLDTNPVSPYYGHITTAPKPGWGNFNIVGSIKKHFDLPIGFATDVNGSLLGEYRWGNGQSYSGLVYWTIGTGIGAGSMTANNIVNCLGHPEMGHIYIPHDKEEDPFVGICPYHGDCLEGLASGPAMQARWNVKSAAELPDGHPAWELEAKYIGYAMANCIMTAVPERIILGGGVMKHEEIHPMICQQTLKHLNGYIEHKDILENIENYIVPAALKGKQGVLGGIALAEIALRHKNW